MRRCYLFRESQENTENERYGGMLKYPRLFKFPPNAFSVCIFEIPQNKNQAPFLFFIVLKKTLSDTWRGLSSPNGMIISLLEWFLLYILIVKFPRVAYRIQRGKPSYDNRHYYKILGVGNDIYADPQISPSLNIIYLAYISTIWGNLTINKVTECEVLQKVIS